MRILLVEDDLQLGKAFETSIRQSGYTVDWVTRGEMAIEAIQTNAFSAVALDINLPDLCGLDVLARVRRRSVVPVVIMTARDGLDDRIQGLDAGGDDYIVKPFDIKELLARLRAVIRRSNGRATGVVAHQDIELDTNARIVKKAGRRLSLTGREYQILSFLMERLGRIFSRSEIQDLVYSWEGEAESNTVEAAIYTLRKKVGRELITNVRGVGYVIHA